MPRDLFTLRPLLNSRRDLQFSLSKLDLEQVTDILRLSWAPSTQAAYSRSLRLFCDFCDRRGIPEQYRFPTHKPLLLICAASYSGKASASTVHRHFSALKAFHVINDLPWHGSPRLTKLMRGIKLAAPISSTRPRRPPITLSMINPLVSRLNLRGPFDVAVVACVCTALESCCHLQPFIPPYLASLLVPTSRDPVLARVTLHISTYAVLRRKHTVMVNPLSSYTVAENQTPLHHCDTTWLSAACPYMPLFLRLPRQRRLASPSCRRPPFLLGVMPYGARQATNGSPGTPSALVAPQNLWLWGCLLT
ncbi:hypothetical protein CVT24_000829 [Panaeolus cyanescens]|uniref:Integrase SAM-like N-terminal domain-containing protein n=1 Tax=Panaeolus cyanescens TaxID=181874 RepID=A0A409X614_9AGAR|nr:hypothetical protein CVT24_000829 [Panaeolus cyanescens]